MEELHDALHVPTFFGAGEEFAIGERTGSSFAETVVRFRVESFVSVEEGDIFFSLTDFFSALVDDRFDAMLDERQSGKESCRTSSDDDGRT